MQGNEDIHGPGADRATLETFTPSGEGVYKNPPVLGTPAEGKTEATPPVPADRLPDAGQTNEGV